MVEEAVEGPEPAAQVLLLDRGLDRGEELVDPLEVGVLHRVPSGSEAELPAGRHERHRKVTVDVRVHPRERELERLDAAARSCLEERQPGAWRLSRVTLEGVERGEVEVGEDDVEPCQEAGVAEGEAREPGLYASRDGQVELCEAGDPVGAGEWRDDGLHPGDDVRDRRGRRRRLRALPHGTGREASSWSVSAAPLTIGLP